ncbi:unnamed protein product [Ectocarpus sp. 8 AP-2014]
MPSVNLMQRNLMSRLLWAAAAQRPAGAMFRTRLVTTAALVSTGVKLNLVTDGRAGESTKDLETQGRKGGTHHQLTEGQQSKATSDES